MPKSKKAPAAPAAPEQFDMVFHVQLAHGSETKQVRDFTNVQQLYDSIAREFGSKGVTSADILYCTLNTHKIDMARLLGGQIGLDDFLFAHVKGASSVAKVTKSGPALGLTISDNGAGFAFVKKIREGSIMAGSSVKVGDHISKINGTDLTGHRHFEVARMLKEIPIGSEFSLDLTSPKEGMSGVAERGAVGGSGNVAAGAGKKTLRMKKDGTAEVVEVNDAVEKIKAKIDDMLEQFVGIRDDELSAQIYDLAKAADEADIFGGALDEKLNDFEFPDDFVLDVHELVNA
jgi:hypothetical protein